MEYRRLGRSGLQVSVLSFGSWVSFGSQLDIDRAVECMHEAYEGGMNFFDNAESYAEGQSESIMGAAIDKLGWARHSYVVSTKVYWGLHDVPNMKDTLNRKYLLQAIDGSLERLGLDFVDLLFCHRSDPNTPIEETVWAMSDIVASGKATYWGTSEWSADEIRAAYDIAERHHLRAPVMEQPQYNMLTRRKVETEFARLYDDLGLGLTDLEPARQRSAHRQIPRWCSRRQPRQVAGLRVGRGHGDRAEPQREGSPARPARRGARLHALAARARLVRGEPARVDRDHRREPAAAGA